MSRPNHPRQAASTSPPQPSRRQAIASSRPRSERIRRSSGPLSSQTMSTIRCPTRADFFQAVSAGDPCAKLPATGGQTFAASTAAMRARKTEIGAKQRVRLMKRREKVREQCGVVVSQEENEECIPVYLNAAVLDAIDRQEEFDELQSIRLWLDDLREKGGFPLRITDVDLSNGVALLDAMFIIDRSLFLEDKEYVVRKLDEGGEAARVNVQKLRDVLSRFPWRDVNDDDRRVESPNFNAVDVWALGGYVLLAAVNCTECEELVNQMLGYEQSVQDDLGDVITRGLKVLGICEEPDECGEEEEDDDEGEGESVEDELERMKRLWEGEVERRKEMERKVNELEAEMSTWKGMYEGMEDIVEKSTRKLEESRAEARRLRAEKAASKISRMSGSTSTSSGGEVDENEGENKCGKRKGYMSIVRELRAENAGLRRKVAEGERRRDWQEREAQRSAREAAWSARKVH